MINPKRAIHFIAASLILIGGITFIIKFDIDLHCTQRTSFVRALFDWTPHDEERPTPWVYTQPWAYPLRIGFGSIFLASLFFPAIYLFGFDIKKYWPRINQVIGVSFCASIFLPSIVIGERLRYLYMASFPLAILGWILVRILNKPNNR